MGAIPILRHGTSAVWYEIYTPSDPKYKGGLDKKRYNSGLQNSFPNRFFYWFRRTAAQRAEQGSF